MIYCSDLKKSPGVFSVIVLSVVLAALLTMAILDFYKPTDIPEVQTIVPVEEAPLNVEPAIDISEEELDLIALVTMAEAEGEPEQGQRLVIDVILNRVDSPHFPDTITDVIYQKNQFTSMWNGRADRCYVQDNILNLVKEEVINRSNSNVVFFRTERYSSFGIPVFRVGDHYFSKYE